MTGAGIFDQDLLIVDRSKKKAQWESGDCLSQWRVHSEATCADKGVF